MSKQNVCKYLDSKYELKEGTLCSDIHDIVHDIVLLENM